MRAGLVYMRTVWYTYGVLRVHSFNVTHFCSTGIPFMFALRRRMQPWCYACSAAAEDGEINGFSTILSRCTYSVIVKKKKKKKFHHKSNCTKGLLLYIAQTKGGVQTPLNNLFSLKGGGGGLNTQPPPPPLGMPMTITMWLENILHFNSLNLFHDFCFFTKTGHHTTPGINEICVTL